MPISRWSTVILAAALSGLLSGRVGLAQDGAKQDVQAAGTNTKNATKDVGSGVAAGTKKAYHTTNKDAHTAARKTSAGTSKTYHKTVNGTKSVGDKTAYQTKRAGTDVKHGTKTAAKDTAHTTENVGDRIAGKPPIH